MTSAIDATIDELTASIRLAIEISGDYSGTIPVPPGTDWALLVDERDIADVSAKNENLFSLIKERDARLLASGAPLGAARIATSGALAPAPPLGRPRITNPSPYEAGYIDYREMNPEFAALICQVSRLNIPNEYFAKLLLMMQQARAQERHFPVREWISEDEVVRSGANAETDVVCSIRFMARYHELVPADTITYTAKGALYVKGDSSALMVRGVPASEDDARTMQRICSTSARQVIFPYVPKINQVFGLALSCVTIKADTKSPTYHLREHSIVPASVRREILAVFESTPHESDKITLINSLQRKFIAHVDLYEKLVALYGKAKEAMEQWLRGIGKDAKGKPIPPHQARINDAATADVTRAQLLKERGDRNRGIGGEVWHRLSNPFSQTTYAAHDLGVLDAFQQALGNFNTPIAVTHVEIGAHLVAHGMFTQHHPLEVLASGDIAPNQREARDILIKGKWRNPGVAGTKDVAEPEIFDTLIAMGRKLAGFRVHYWGNVLQIKQNVSRSGLKHWKLENCVKAGGLHTPDFIITMTYSADPIDTSPRDFQLKFDAILTIAALVGQYMERARQVGDLDTPFGAVISRLAIAQGGQYYHLRTGKCKNYHWQEGDLKVLRKITVVAHDPITDAIIPEAVAVDDLI